MNSDKDIVLKVENLTKVYRLGEVGTGTIAHDLNRAWARLRGKEDPMSKVGAINDRTQKAQKGEYVKVLDNIDFEVKKGEVLGIIGKNGAGKSTLLKVISQITSPTSGKIKAKGRIASLLEVGTGMHPEMTGKENVYLNGTILGMTRKEIDSKFDEIMDFAGCTKYADTPVKRYSSGMKVRLGFAVAAFLEPEILIVDEVLAVGDAEFQEKAIGKMKDISTTGSRTILFVSHNMASINIICENVMVLENGQIVFYGDVNEGIDNYLHSNVPRNQLIKNVFPVLNSPIQFQSIEITNCSESGEIEYLSRQIQIGIALELRNSLPDIFLGVIVQDEQMNYLIVSTTDEIKSDPLLKLKPGIHNLEVTIPGKILKPGKYYLSFSLRNKEEIFHKSDKELSFTIVDNQSYRGMKNRYRRNVLVAPEIGFRMKK